MPALVSTVARRPRRRELHDRRHGRAHRGAGGRVHPLGARVVVAASSAGRVAFARSLGAVDGRVYPASIDGPDAVRALDGELKALVGPRGADVVLDPVGGACSEAALRAIAREGRFLVVGFVAGIPRVPLNLVLPKACRIIGVDVRMFREVTPDREGPVSP
jgi:NADPH:quinone reductase-like Zn-dependent oxidoreductase